MTHVVARAPGKLVLTGEYAVLCGAPAVVAAVDRHAEVRLRLAPGRGPVTVESSAERRRWVVPDAERERPSGGDIGAVVAAWRVASARAPGLAAREAEIAVDSAAFLSDGKKLGLGRSAATVTAAVAALLAAAGERGRSAIFEAAVAAHTRFQDGRGSGADVASAVHGGVIEFRRSEGRLAVAERTLPPGLRLLVGWTGESMATDPLLRRLDAVLGTRRSATLTELCAVAERAADAVARADAGALTAAVADTAGLLARLGDELGLPIVTPALARLVDAAHRAGAVAKPSGAGGGDCGIALATSAPQAEAVCEAWRGAGIVPLTLAVSPEGVCAEVAAERRGEVALG